MISSVYRINKGINKPIEFKGLKAQYIVYLAIGLIVLLIAFAVMYIVGVNMFLCLGIVGSLGTILFMNVFRLSARFGQYGLMKWSAKKRLPHLLVSNSRKMFLDLNRL